MQSGYHLSHEDFLSDPEQVISEGQSHSGQEGREETGISALEGPTEPSDSVSLPPVCEPRWLCAALTRGRWDTQF